MSLTPNWWRYFHLHFLCLNFGNFNLRWETISLAPNWWLSLAFFFVFIFANPKPPIFEDIVELVLEIFINAEKLAPNWWRYFHLHFFVFISENFRPPPYLKILQNAFWKCLLTLRNYQFSIKLTTILSLASFFISENTRPSLFEYIAELVSEIFINAEKLAV